MRLNYDGLKDSQGWSNAGISLPTYDPQALARHTHENPIWVHFGIGNIFRIFVGGIADKLISSGLMDTGIICAETFDFDIVDKIYNPFDNLVLSVVLHPDGRTDKSVLGSLTEALKAQPKFADHWTRLKEIFASPSLQLISFTITEKGYALRGADGNYLSYVKNDMNNGPANPSGAMAVVASMLYERFKAGKYPLALVSMDNVSRNGKKLRDSVVETVKTWQEKGLVEPEFAAYVQDEKVIAFPWTMIDKITPRPSDDVAAKLEADGVESMKPIVTSRSTYIAPFVNAEDPGYLVVEDSFPNGRPPLEKAGMYLTDRDTVNLSERMKVTACLNPIHSALCTYDIMLGYKLFADGMHDPQLSALANKLGYDEALPVVVDPKIISPKKFLDECINVRFPNPYLGDTSARIATDISQGLAFRFGETIKAYIARDGSAQKLHAVPIAIAGWVRYLLALDDDGQPYELSPDPLNGEMTDLLKGVEFGKPETLGEKLKRILGNVHIFGVNLYEAGLGEKITGFVSEMLKGKGSVREFLKNNL